MGFRLRHCPPRIPMRAVDYWNQNSLSSSHSSRPARPNTTGIDGDAADTIWPGHTTRFEPSDSSYTNAPRILRRRVNFHGSLLPHWI